MGQTDSASRAAKCSFDTLTASHSYRPRILHVQRPRVDGDALVEEKEQGQQIQFSTRRSEGQDSVCLQHARHFLLASPNIGERTDRPYLPIVEMVVGMRTDLVPAISNCPDNVLPSLDVPSQHEESGPHIVFSQQFQNGRGETKSGAVIERQYDTWIGSHPTRLPPTQPFDV